MPVLDWGNPLALTFGITLFELMTFFVIAEILSAKPSMMRTILSSRALVFLGQISYGLYLYHYPIIFFLRDRFQWYETLAIGFTATLAISITSYYLVERRFLRGRKSLPSPMPEHGQRLAVENNLGRSGEAETVGQGEGA
jgi:peptidoglycan/LPS O-acetylase OafA/YrhL